MRVAGGSVFPLDQQTLWALLNDPEVLRRCAPGCEQLDKAEDGQTFVALMKIGVGSVKGTYRCTLGIAVEAPPDRYALTISGKGPFGSIDGRILVTLACRDGGRATELAWEGDVEVGGVIASVGQPLLKSVADYQAKQFFDALHQEATRRAAVHDAR